MLHGKPVRKSTWRVSLALLSLKRSSNYEKQLREQRFLGHETILLFLLKKSIQRKLFSPPQIVECLPHLVTHSTSHVVRCLAETYEMLPMRHFSAFLTDYSVFSVEVCETTRHPARTYRNNKSLRVLRGNFATLALNERFWRFGYLKMVSISRLWKYFFHIDLLSVT